MTIPMVELKVLSFSDKPDSDGDVIRAEAVYIGETIHVYHEVPAPQNFIGFANPEKRDDGLWIRMPAPMLQKYNGLFPAPQGQCRGVQVEKVNGIPCRLISHLEVSAINLTPQHSDRTIAPINVASMSVVAASVVEPRVVKVKSKAKAKKIVVKAKASDHVQTSAPKKKAAPRVSSKKKGSGKPTAADAGGSGRADSGSKPSSKKARFKRRRN